MPKKKLSSYFYHEWTFYHMKGKKRDKEMMKNLNKYGHEPYISNLVSNSIQNYFQILNMNSILYSIHKKMFSTFEINPNKSIYQPSVNKLTQYNCLVNRYPPLQKYNTYHPQFLMTILVLNFLQFLELECFWFSICTKMAQNFQVSFFQITKFLQQASNK